MILLLTVAVPVVADSIDSVSPAVGYRGETMTLTITGMNFTTTEGDVRLMKSDENNITAAISSWGPATIVCTVAISSSKATGTWDVVIIKGVDDTEIVKDSAFSITDPMELTSISPTSGQPDNDSIDFTLAGSGLSDVENVYLYNKAYDNITADSVDAASSTKVTGTFDLSDANESTYDVCVEDSYNVVKCDLSFEIYTEEVGTVVVSSEPTGASIYVDGSLTGTTPDTVKNLVAGSHKLVLKKTGYDDWGKIVTVVADDETEVDATLNQITTAAPTAVQTAQPMAEATAVRTAQPTTARTTRASTVVVPTPWPSTTTEAAASPIEPAVIISTLGLAFLALRKH
jgi:hypothetical protein